MENLGQATSSNFSRERFFTTDSVTDHITQGIGAKDVSVLIKDTIKKSPPDLINEVLKFSLILHEDKKKVVSPIFSRTNKFESCTKIGVHNARKLKKLYQEG